jgi:hypothetical protein
VLGCLGLVAFATGISWRLQPRVPTEPPSAAVRIVPLTSLIGWESEPTFSPDGDQVAFSWAGEDDDNADIYATIVGSSDVRRLTTDPGEDNVPRTGSPLCARSSIQIFAPSNVGDRLRP